MPIDTSIYSQLNNKTQDPMETYGKVLTLKQMIGQNATQEKQAEDQRTMSDLLKKNTSVDASGKASLNRGAALSDLYKVNPQKAMDFQKYIKEQDLDELDKNTKIAKTLAWQTTPDNYTQIRSKAIELGLPNADKIPEYYSPEFTQRWQLATLEGEKQLSHAMEQRKLEADMANKSKYYDYQQDKMNLDWNELKAKQQAQNFKREDQQIKTSVKQDEKRQALETPYGVANTLDDAKLLKEAHESKNSFDNKVQQMIDLRTKHGGGAILNREDVARAKQLSKDALLDYKNMVKLGVLSKSDEDIINAIIPSDPLEYNSPLAASQGQDPILNNLQKFKEDSDMDFTTRIKTRTREGMKNYNNQKQIPSAANPQISSQETSKTFKTNQIEWAD
jgi:hypothetical protein